MVNFIKDFRGDTMKFDRVLNNDEDEEDNFFEKMESVVNESCTTLCFTDPDQGFTIPVIGGILVSCPKVTSFKLSILGASSDSKHALSLFSNFLWHH